MLCPRLRSSLLITVKRYCQLVILRVLVTNDCASQTLLSLREIIREEDQNTRVTLLEYLKQLHPIEWQNFVKDTMILAEETAMFNGVNPFANDEKGQSKANQ